MFFSSRLEAGTPTRTDLKTLKSTGMWCYPSHPFYSAALPTETPSGLLKTPRADTTRSVIGGTAMYDAGTAQEYIVCSEEDVEIAPEHLSAIEGAALPLVGLTGWRALVTKTGENASRGRNILITGYVSAMLFLSDCFRMLQGVPGNTPSCVMGFFACYMACSRAKPGIEQGLESNDSCMARVHPKTYHSTPENGTVC